MPDLLIELFSEEIPARMQARAADDLRRLVTDGLVEAGLTYKGAAGFATPRRLCLSIEGLDAESKPVREERKGPATTAPDKAIEGFLRATGLSKEQLEIRPAGKAEAYFAVIEKPGRKAAEIIAEVLEPTIRNFPWPKAMRWGAGSLRWVRPLHSIICLLTDEGGAEVVPFEIDGITAGNTTRGHRFLSEGTITVSGFDDYEAKLKKAHVILRTEERADHIWHDATNMAFARGMEVVEDKGLLAEVAGLVEWPVVLLGEIGVDFLGLPPEVLQTSMKEHQKFFSVRNPKSGRIEGFVTVANMETADKGATILAGNQKVLSARLSDAKFFWENDLRVAKAGMGNWTDGLANVTFHAKLGSQADRVARIAALARDIAPAVGADADKAEEAAMIAKADLRSEMVGEFPELQGVMGRYYALEAGRATDVANAARDHWKPMGQGDDVPSDPVAVAVALADKLDTLTGFWAIDEKPTGSKDPFALRRAALGVIRLVLENDLRLSLDRYFDGQLLRLRARQNGHDETAHQLLNEMLDEIADHGVFGAAVRTVIDRFDGDTPDAVEQARTEIPDTSENLLAFFHDRLKVFLKDQGIRHDVIDACVAMQGNDDLTLLVKRAQALSAFMATEDGENLIQGFKRANNILSQAEEKDGVEYSFGADAKFAEGPEETALFAALDGAEAAIGPAMEAEDFGAVMGAMAGLRAPIDAFFEAVQVNADNAVVRRNRLNLLSRIRTICLSVADLTRIEG
ncbi:glycine--tRNA ligase subunit beta [Loktanella sp. IMCC34160]|uniref:glycine--tRNA ligase subunit beta n=1 Tax=Loktanella sp. IMCC34160 TaxID=2510646 RepID=UPI00101BFBA2|nr:glycine--tRNA ligase subunit beta [Loktanella sp. IMCC34160]RYG93034.1 glycine--tRNA ligase subunit beta [Loktanella sp. IMCC34160]